MSNLKVGRVVRIRVNPGDCMGVADVIAKLGIEPRRLSFDQAVRVALSSLLESARQHNTIPTRSGFDFSKLMEPFRMSNGMHASKLEVTNLIDNTEVIRAVMPDVGRDKRLRRYEELKFLFDSDPNNHPKPAYGTPEYVEWSALVDEFVEV